MRFVLCADGRADRTRQSEELTEYVACDHCGVDDAKRYLTIGGHYSDDLFVLVRCRRCGLVYVNPRLNASFRTSCYANETHLVDWFRQHAAKARADAERVLDLIASLDCTGGKLLEVGCGLGTLLDAARARAFDVTGLELNRGLADDAGRRHAIIRADFFDAPMETKVYDVVVMEQTLEHLGRPAEALRKAHEVLVPGGLLYVSVPALDWLRVTAARVPGSRWLDSSTWSPEDHLYYFLPQTLNLMLGDAGFQAVRPVERTIRAHARWLLGLSSGRYFGRKAKDDERATYRAPVPR